MAPRVTRTDSELTISNEDPDTSAISEDIGTAKRTVLARKLIEIANDIEESPIENPWHLEEIAKDVAALHYKVRMASYQ